MKNLFKRKLIVLTIALSTVGLSACNSGSSGLTASGGTTAAKTVSSSNKLATGNSLQAAPEPLFKNSFVNWVWESNKGAFGMAFAAFPATWAAGVLQNLIFGVQEDVSIKYMKEISEKLNQILTKLETSMNISAITLDTISEFYKAYTGNALTDSFTLVQTSINDVQAKYSEFTTANVFGSNSSSVTDLSSLYAYAGQHCSDVAIIDAIDVTSSTTGTDSQYDVDTMFTTFTTTYSAESTTLGDASAYKKVAAAKVNYKNAMVSTFPKSMDFMSYINRYNYTVKYYGMNLVASYQKLYNMQLAQLAYHYACNASIEFSNLGNISGSGESGFEQTVTKLDSEYASKFTNLNNNVNTYFSGISNTELYTMINTQMFSSSKPLLNSTTFNSNIGNAGECTVSKLKFDQSHTDGGTSNGIVDFNAICVKSKTGIESETKYESTTIMLEIPYHSADGKTLDRYGQYNIKYESANNDFTHDLSTDALDSGDVEHIAFERQSEFAPKAYWENKESMNILAPSWMWKVGSHMEYQPFAFNAGTGVKFYNEKYTNSQGVTDFEKNTKATYSNFMPSYGDGHIGMSDINIQRTRYEDIIRSAWGDRCDDPRLDTVDCAMAGYEYWFLGNYHGKTFIVKIVTQKSAHGDGTDNYLLNTNEIYNKSNTSSIQAVGIFCSTDNCSRKDDGTGDNDNKTTLTWTDGTQLVSDNDTTDVTLMDDIIYTTIVTGSITK
ncbi:MAG: hypothetical protein K2Y14_01700 [Burkholderiales bacterium]|nr:hypothetical protein [Burkholderiales bacterium]MBX9890464.1 hypothetical protein [Amoebophilaceae bacterium]